VCGRYATTRRAADLAALFEAADATGGLAPRYNLAPTDPAPLVSQAGGGRELGVGRWGLLPHWATDRRAGGMINARAETVVTSPAYAASFARRRALVPADGWYEWQRVDGTTRQAYFMTPADGSVLAFAGIWSRWRDHRLVTFCVVTTAATGALARVHDRMPLLLPPADWDRWLTGGPGGEAATLLRPPPAALLAKLEVRPVGPTVGNVRNDGPELVARVDPLPATGRLW
jgi:putative SOS response-associated peptidase YedK